METAEATVEMPEATVETAEPESGEAVKAMVVEWSRGGEGRLLF